MSLSRKLLVYFLLFAGAALFSIPILWCLSTALKSPSEVYAFPPKWIPIPAHWDNFAKAWNALPFPTFVWNTLFISGVGTVGEVLTASLVAYGFARFKFPGSRFLFIVMLATMMLPSQVTMIPVFMIWRQLRAIDTFYPLTVPSFFGGGAFNIFLLRQFFMSVPKELDEAAMMDGASYFRIWWQFLLPLSLPAIATVSIFSFMGKWDDFMGPLIYLNSPEKYTVSVGLKMFQDSYGTNLEQLMAASLIHILPVVVLFFIGQRYFMKGINLSGLSGR
jgi:multiple sugar transport system permease protein